MRLNKKITLCSASAKNFNFLYRGASLEFILLTTFRDIDCTNIVSFTI